MARYAAIDVGSNSIRLLVANVDKRGRTRILASDRQVVRLGTGVFRVGRVTLPAMELACRVLQRMADEYRRLDVDGVRAVATSAIRDATNQLEFVARASAVLGSPLEVVSGIEEARLVQLGVQARWPHPRTHQLIVDIGGGSAQVILSRNGRFMDAFSKPLGAVRLTEMFMKSDPPHARELARMQKYIRDRLAAPLARYGRAGVRRMVATSSTAAAVVCAVNQVKRERRDEADQLAATPRQVQELYQKVTSLDVVGRARITGIGPRRAEIIVAGTAVLQAVMVGMKLPRLHYSTAGVRDGIIADLAQRE